MVKSPLDQEQAWFTEAGALPGPVLLSRDINPAQETYTWVPPCHPLGREGPGQMMQHEDVLLVVLGEAQPCTFDPGAACLLPASLKQ